MVSVAPLEGDTDPPPLLGNLPGSNRHRSRIASPAVRPGTSTLRGAGPYGRASAEPGHRFLKLLGEYTFSRHS